ncbi:MULTISPECIES: alpha-ribazole phosphatase [Methylomicrobium]|uniref:Alpha-ribazole phosphatase n=1 Tax=Methylomicrobium album BG8 TaxID=686340 RepID=H8GJ53_METAL|nr:MULTISPECIES: alpha-ribazole phosphatase [Methylomicrobium]EIC31560.1 alpha-ribazole phosphatase [Methylomicrobium album BG8]
MDIYLIRHTRTATEIGLCYGQTDVALSPGFSEELAALRQKLPASVECCAVYSSPLTRCMQLAETLSPSVIVDDRLLELNFGRWEGRRFDEIEPDLLSRWTGNFVETAPPDGESFTDLCERVGGFWQELLSQPHEQVLIVTHAGAIRALLARVLDLPPANAFQLRIDPGSVHKLRRQHDYTYIDYLNR